MGEFYGKGVLELIPQRSPIVMIDAFKGETGSEAVTGLAVTDDNMFCGDGYLMEPGIIEHIAQSASALAGFNAKEAGETVPIGLIGEVRKFRIHFLPAVGDTLNTHIRIVSEINGITLLEAVTRAGDRVSAECQMKIFIQKT